MQCEFIKLLDNFQRLLAVDSHVYLISKIFYFALHIITIDIWLKTTMSYEFNPSDE